MPQPLVDKIGRTISAGQPVFYHGNVYTVVRATNGKRGQNFLYLQYAKKEYQLSQPKKVWSHDTFLITEDITNWLNS